MKLPSFRQDGIDSSFHSSPLSTTENLISNTTDNHERTPKGEERKAAD